MMKKPKRRSPSTHVGRSSVPDKSQRSRSMSFSPERVRVRGRSPAFSALAANFENPNNIARNLSTPLPAVSKLYPKSGSPDTANPVPKSAAIASLTASFETSKESIIKPVIMPKSLKGGTTSMSNRIESLTIQEDAKEKDAEEEEGLPIFPYERLKVNSADPITEIDATKRETYLSSAEFKEKFGMGKGEFYKLPKWKQNKLKMNIQLF